MKRRLSCFVAACLLGMVTSFVACGAEQKENEQPQSVTKLPEVTVNIPTP